MCESFTSRGGYVSGLRVNSLVVESKGPLMCVCGEGCKSIRQNREMFEVTLCSHLQYIILSHTDLKHVSTFQGLLKPTVEVLKTTEIRQCGIPWHI